MDAPPESLGAVAADHGWRLHLPGAIPPGLLAANQLNFLAMMASTTLATLFGGCLASLLGAAFVVFGVALVAAMFATYTQHHRIALSHRGVHLGRHFVPAHELQNLRVKFRGPSPPRGSKARVSADLKLGECALAVRLSHDEAAWLMRAVAALRDDRPRDERVAERARMHAALKRATERAP